MTHDLWRLVDAAVFAALDGDGVVVDQLVRQIVKDNADEVAAASVTLAGHAIADRIRRTCKKALQESSQQTLPGFEDLPAAVNVPDVSGGVGRYVSIRRVTVEQLRRAIKAQRRQVKADQLRIKELKRLLQSALAAGAADSDVVAMFRAPMLRAAE